MIPTPLDIERATIATWPARITEEHGGWFYLAEGGVTGRVNAVWPLDWRGGDLKQAIWNAERWYMEQGLPCAFKITDGAYEPSGLPETLRERGYQDSQLTQIMTRPLAPTSHEDRAISRHDAMPPAFDDVIRATSADDAEYDERRAIALRAPSPSLFAVFPGASGADAIGMCAITSKLAGVFLMRTRPEARRQGLARRILATLLSWAAERGASTAFLQVESDNRSAIDLYRSQGFETLSYYRFWRKAPSDPLDPRRVLAPPSMP